MRAVPSLEDQVPAAIRRPHPAFIVPDPRMVGRRDGCPDCTTRDIAPFYSIEDSEGGGGYVSGYWCHICNALWLTSWGC